MRKPKKEKNNAQPKSIQNILNRPILEVEPKSANQQKTFDAFETDDHLFLMGSAGTGKTFISLYLALEEILSGDETPYESVQIVRSVVPSRDMGFLPGSAKDKGKAFEQPYDEICTKLFERGDAYSLLKQRGVIQFNTTSFLRGTTFENCILFVDEIQNLDKGELHTILTRVGENCKIVCSGDIRQSDLRGKAKGIDDVLLIAKSMPCFQFIEFGPEDIVRSGFVKAYLLTRMRLEDEGLIEPL